MRSNIHLELLPSIQKVKLQTPENLSTLKCQAECVISKICLHFLHLFFIAKRHKLVSQALSSGTH